MALPFLLTRQEAADRERVSLVTFNKLLRDGRGPAEALRRVVPGREALGGIKCAECGVSDAEAKLMRLCDPGCLKQWG